MYNHTTLQNLNKTGQQCNPWEKCMLTPHRLPLLKYSYRKGVISRSTQRTEIPSPGPFYLTKEHTHTCQEVIPSSSKCVVKFSGEIVQSSPCA